MRTKNSIKNTFYAIGGQLSGTILSFICRTLFINILGTNYLGINGLFGNILSMLSLAELGIGSAIIYSMYKPLAEKDERETKALMGFYASAYFVIGCVVAVAGLVLVPFLDYLIKDKPNIPHLTVIYLMFLANSVVTYFFAYKRSIISADQKNYINTINEMKFNFLQNIVQIILLIVTKNYFIYLTIQIICSFMVNIAISKKADKMYPFLKNGKKEYLSKEDKKDIFKNTSAMMSHKIGNVVVNGTDNVLISSFVGVYWVGLYSNYIMIINIINGLINQIFASVTASIGNLNALEDSEKSNKIFNVLFFINFWLYGFCSISLFVLLNPFITMWIGKKYIMDNYIVIIIVINFFVMGMRQSVIIYNSTLGLFWNDRFKPWFEAVINLAASIVLMKKFGIVGVFLGTFISTMTTSFWVEPYILYKHRFRKRISAYFMKYVIYTSATLISAMITLFASSIFTAYTLLSVIGRGILCMIIPNLIFIILFFKTEEFKYMYNNVLTQIFKSGKIFKYNKK